MPKAKATIAMNPYQSPVDVGKRNHSVDTEASAVVARKMASLLIGLLGAPLGATLCSLGYMMVVQFLERACVPPLNSPSSYGQFELKLILLGFYGLIYGVSFGLIPYTRFLLWLLIFGVITIFLFYGDVSDNFDPTEVTCAAMIVIGCMIVSLAALTSIYAGRISAANEDHSARIEASLEE
jgi:hypothetical protein